MFSSPLITIGVIIMVRIAYMQVGEAILDETELSWFASCLVIGQVSKFVSPP